MLVEQRVEVAVGLTPPALDRGARDPVCRRTLDGDDVPELSLDVRGVHPGIERLEEPWGAPSSPYPPCIPFAILYTARTVLRCMRTAAPPAARLERPGKVVLLQQSAADVDRRECGVQPLLGPGVPGGLREGLQVPVDPTWEKQVLSARGLECVGRHSEHAI